MSNEEEILFSSPGEPGKPGEASEGTTGGAGGAGGAGGKGQQTGGVGGAGGYGGEAHRGPRGYQGPPGKNAPRRAMIGYAILSLALIILAIYAYGTRQKLNQVCRTHQNIKACSKSHYFFLKSLGVSVNGKPFGSNPKTVGSNPTAPVLNTERYSRKASVGGAEDAF